MPNHFLTLTPPSLRRPGAGLIAGAIGGLISGFVKLGWEVPFPPRAPGRIPEPQILVSMFTHHPTPEQVGWIIHFTFSIAFGALYGALVEFLPIAAVGMGMAYGIAIWLGAHEVAMPLIGLTPPTWALSAQEQLSEFFGHAVWGFTIEIFRHDLRPRFGGTKADSEAF
jgi:putative membrane protein